MIISEFGYRVNKYRESKAANKTVNCSMLLCNKDQYQDILTKRLKFQDNFKLQDNLRTLLRFQEFQDNWDPCYQTHLWTRPAFQSQLHKFHICISNGCNAIVLTPFCWLSGTHTGQNTRYHLSWFMLQYVSRTTFWFADPHTDKQIRWKHYKFLLLQLVTITRT